MAEYLVLLREDPAVTRKLGPTEMQALIKRYSEWVGGLRADGFVVSADSYGQVVLAPRAGGEEAIVT